MSKKAESVTAQKKIDKISAHVVREANNRILTAGSVLSQGGRGFIYRDGLTGRYIDATTANPRKTHVIDVTGVNFRLGDAIDIVSIPVTLKRTLSGTVISKDSVQRAAKSAMSQFRSKKK